MGIVTPNQFSVIHPWKWAIRKLFSFLYQCYLQVISPFIRFIDSVHFKRKSVWVIDIQSRRMKMYTILKTNPTWPVFGNFGK